MTSCISIANTSIAEDYSHILKLVHAQLVPLSGDVGQPLLITLHTSILQFVCKVWLQRDAFLDFTNGKTAKAPSKDRLSSNVTELFDIPFMCMATFRSLEQTLF